jgi:calcineurin-like phosphoesterase family protein
MAVYFTSDLHFWHSRIIEFCSRPFASREEMNEALIYNWNQTVKVDDQIYIAGDFSFGSATKIQDILKKLNGRKTIILGNHDYEIRKRCDTWAKDYFEHIEKGIYNLRLQDPDATRTKGVQHLVLCHFPIGSWEGMHHGAWDLFGHSHGSYPENPGLRQLDVGVDMMAKLQERKRGIPGHLPEDYRPFTYQEVKDYMATKVFAPVDHHREEDAY